MTEPNTAEQFAVAMQRANDLSPLQWIRKAMLQAYRAGCQVSIRHVQSWMNNDPDSGADLADTIRQERDSKRLEDF